jgi:sorting nexin-4
MAVIDQDNFSNISWHSDHHDIAGQPSMATPIEAEPPTAEDEHHGEDLLQQDPGLSGDVLECTVAEPRKESDGTKDAFVSYLVTSTVSLEAASRRRNEWSCSLSIAHLLIRIRL